MRPFARARVGLAGGDRAPLPCEAGNATGAEQSVFAGFGGRWHQSRGSMWVDPVQKSESGVLASEREAQLKHVMVN